MVLVLKLCAACEVLKDVPVEQERCEVCGSELGEVQLKGETETISVRERRVLTAEGCVDIHVEKVPRVLLAEFDAAIRNEYPGGRSEALRDLMRHYVEEKSDKLEGKGER